MPLFSLDSLFKKEKVQETASVSQISVSPNDRRQGETYHNWGLRICATVMGSQYSLPPYLQKVYYDIYNEQAKDIDLQKQLKKNIQMQIDECKNNIESLNAKVSNSENKLSDNKASIEKLERQKADLRTKGKTTNKDARIKMLLGIIILLPLTFYLFLFYSSTFYTGFLMDESDITETTNIAMAMFNPHAFAGALSKGLTSLFLILSFPVIFLGLGFGLHFFSVQQTKSKYVKMGAILLVTFLFDCIIAYKIGEFLYDMKSLWQDLPPYTFDIAIRDINTYAVIFCGFISYIIWGIVFDMAMTAYSKLDLNKEESKALDKKIQSIKDENKKIQDQIVDYNHQINNCKNSISSLTAKLSDHVNIDFNIIKQEMTNFYNGWITQMGVLGCPQHDQSIANATFKNTLNSLIPKNN